MQLPAGPFEGRTYSLRDRADEAHRYFEDLDALMDGLLRRTPDPNVLLRRLRRAAHARKRWRPASRKMMNVLLEELLESGGGRLERYFRDPEPFRRSLSAAQRCSGVLGMTRGEYILAAVEIECMNRVNAPAFASARKRIALLPHCLRDLTADCRARTRGMDYVCFCCSASCYVHAASTFLRKHRIAPYIWMEAELADFLREKGTAVLGIACVPELVAGMRRCARAGVPAIGLPLDANRCVRWMGAFHPNSINLDRLAALVSPPPRPGDWNGGAPARSGVSSRSAET